MKLLFVNSGGDASPSLAIFLATLTTNDHEIFHSVQTKWHEISGGNLYDVPSVRKYALPDKIKKRDSKFCILEPFLAIKTYNIFCKRLGILGRSGHAP